MNVLLISEDPVALDTVYCYLVNLDPELVPTNSQGCRMGIGTDKEEEIEIKICDADNEVISTKNMMSQTEADPDIQADFHIISRQDLLKKYGNPAFDVGREIPKNTFLIKYSNFMTKHARRPVIDKEKCVKCGICVEHCPVPGKAVDFKNGKTSPPVYDYKKCIRCYCCQEMCPRHAIKPVRGLFRKK
jgi:Pyruvate/2-oxoacid:ferredoxin oxidoreductase delta subunit